MSARIPSRRLGQSALAVFQPRSTYWITSTSLPATAQRNISNPFKPRNTDDELRNPILESYLQKKEIEEGAADNNAKPARPSLREGELSKHPSSLFLPEREIPGWQQNLTPTEQAKLKEQARVRREAVDRDHDRKLSAMNIDPDANARKSLERKLVISGVKRHGRMTKAQKLLRTERQSLYKSHFLPTSVKKLQKVVNQLAGKTVSEALVQLRFSPKKVARDVIKGLEIAQNEAIVARGMGLQGEEVAVKRWESQRKDTDAGKPRDLWDYKTSEGEKKPLKAAKKAKTTTVELKDGSKKLVRDPSEIYIDQMWVGPGESWKTPEFRARGMINMLTHRTTSFSVLLKEEKTRMRISEEIKKKRDNRKLWVALPDRPVIAQRQYCLW
ncbi:ribosomal protein L22 [Cucurbitaria berberidis CBS 394.84]|uniref:Ribosomal protein L22 n=1 Tax=Cucurbitaria berberidis CBS 394.84 TaxID=1168544 RepID=A0A9P4GCG1_9PLEO|nr:ribosomal protein L22 [Cucurbitaria berberidis CBS 394.84]KAF1843045.1 ribosomal protein L22 [Cucurbitaria berberidis CBS 394.84]